MNIFKTLIMIVFINWSGAGQAENNFHLSLGLGPSMARMQTTLGDEVTYGGGSIYTAFHYHLADWSIGVKSQAFIGAHNLGRQVELRSSPMPIKRYIQFVSFAPFVEYVLPRTFFGNMYAFLNVGYSVSQTSLSFMDNHRDRDQGVHKKTTLSGDGFDTSFGMYTVEKQDGAPSYFAINYQHILPRKQTIVDITDTTDARSLETIKEYDLEKLQFISLIFGTFLF